MEITEAIDLIAPALPNKIRSIWADLGCGAGVFTHALAALLERGSVIHAVDKSNQEIVSKNVDVNIQFMRLDMEKDSLPFQNLDGILLANSLHYVKDKVKFVDKIKKYLKPNGKIILVEYNMQAPNPWVPFPIPFGKAGELFNVMGFRDVKKIGERQSIYRKEKMYACVISDLRIE